MKFTDNDLKRLKADSPRNRIYLDFEKTNALLARLEAAEAYAKASYENLDSGSQYDWIDLLHQAWRESKGL